MTNHRKGPSQTDDTNAQGQATDDDDVEGHGMIQGGVDPRTLARDRQREIQSQADKRSLMDRVRGR